MPETEPAKEEPSVHTARSVVERMLVWTLVLSVVLMLPFFQNRLRADEPEAGRRIKLGQVYFDEFCTACHGGGGQGGGPVARALRVPPPNLTEITLRRGQFNDEDLLRIIDGRIEIESHGTREMPIWGRVLSPDTRTRDLDSAVTRSRITAIVAYLRSIQVRENRTHGRAATATTSI